MEVGANNTSQFTRQGKKSAEEHQNGLAITDHATRENHVTDWDQAKLVWHDRRTRWVKEAIAICTCNDVYELRHRVILSAVQL